MPIDIQKLINLAAHIIGAVITGIQCNRVLKCLTVIVAVGYGDRSLLRSVRHDKFRCAFNCVIDGGLCRAPASASIPFIRLCGRDLFVSQISGSALRFIAVLIIKCHILGTVKTHSSIHRPVSHLDLVLIRCSVRAIIALVVQSVHYIHCRIGRHGSAHFPGHTLLNVVMIVNIQYVKNLVADIIRTTIGSAHRKRFLKLRSLIVMVGHGYRSGLRSIEEPDRPGIFPHHQGLAYFRIAVSEFIALECIRIQNVVHHLIGHRNGIPCKMIPGNRLNGGGILGFHFFGAQLIIIDTHNNRRLKIHMVSEFITRLGLDIFKIDRLLRLAGIIKLNPRCSVVPRLHFPYFNVTGIF